MNPHQPLYAYANEHAHVCPICGGAILECPAVSVEGRPATRIEEFMRPDTEPHYDRLRNAMLEHRCNLAQDRIRYEQFLRAGGFKS